MIDSSGALLIGWRRSLPCVRNRSIAAQFRVQRECADLPQNSSGLALQAEPLRPLAQCTKRCKAGLCVAPRDAARCRRRRCRDDRSRSMARPATESWIASAARDGSADCERHDHADRAIRAAPFCLLWQAAAAVPQQRRADDYPSRPVKIIVPFGAGGPTDVFTRAVSVELRKLPASDLCHGEPPGRRHHARHRPRRQSRAGRLHAADGFGSTQTVNETLYTDKPYQLMRDLVPIAPLIDTDLVLVVILRCRRKNLAELLALARAKPGRSITARPGRAPTITWPASF